MLAGIESLSERIREYNERIEGLAKQSYPQVALLKQVKGVGTLIALTFPLTLEDSHRFRKSRDVGCYLGLQPGRRNSGQSEPQIETRDESNWSRCNRDKKNRARTTKSTTSITVAKVVDQLRGG